MFKFGSKRFLCRPIWPPRLPVNAPGASSHRQQCFHPVKGTTHLDTTGPMKLHSIALGANLKVLANSAHLHNQHEVCSQCTHHLCGLSNLIVLFHDALGL